MAATKKKCHYSSLSSTLMDSDDQDKKEPKANASLVASTSNRVELKKELNLLHSTAIMTGIMIGSGIFVSPVSITHHCGSIGLSLIVWAASGLLTLFMALCYGELGIMFGTSGAEYAYFRATIGQWMAFVYAWVLFVAVNPSFYALLALTTSSYMFQPFFPDCSAPLVAVKLFSICVVGVIVFLNSVYVRYVARVQTVFMFAKISILIVIIIAGVIQIAKGKTAVLETGFENTSTDPGSVAIAFYSGIFTYGGWQYIFMLIEEVKSPQRIIPQASIISFTVVTIIYLCTNVAYFSVMTPDQMMASHAVAVDFGRLALGKFGMIIPIFVASSTIGALNGSIFGGSRVTYTAARDGAFPSVLSMIHMRYLTPTPAVGISCVLTIMFILSGEAVSILEYLGFVTCVISSIAIGVLLYMRVKEPNRKRPFKIPLVIPVVTLGLLVSLSLLGLIKDPTNNGIGLLIGVAGIPVYLIFVQWEYKPRVFTDTVNAAYVLVQKLFVVLLPEGTDTADTNSSSSVD